MNLEKKFGQNVRSLRKKHGLSQEELADRAQLHPTYVSGIETGYRNPTVKIIGRLAKALNVEPATLFAMTDWQSDQSRDSEESAGSIREHIDSGNEGSFAGEE